VPAGWRRVIALYNADTASEALILESTSLSAQKQLFPSAVRCSAASARWGLGSSVRPLVILVGWRPVSRQGQPELRGGRHRAWSSHTQG
jgi:hypothetical protein